MRRRKGREGRAGGARERAEQRGRGVECAGKEREEGGERKRRKKKRKKKENGKREMEGEKERERAGFAASPTLGRPRAAPGRA